MTLRVLIVDDEPPARRRLARLVTAAGHEVVAEVGDADAAMVAIAALDPDVALLDIQMPGTDGVTLARALGARPAAIFTTAHAAHAVDAFDAAAVDFLLKPIAADRLVRALARAGERLGRAPAPAPRVIARHGDAVRVFAASAIARFRADHKYTAFAVDGVEHLTEESLASLEARLAAIGFARVHRGELIQVGRIVALVGDGDSADAVLDDGQRVPVSRRLLPGLRRRVQSP